MIALSKANTADIIRLTLTENEVTTPSSYSIVFTSRLTKEVVTASGLSDTSTHKERYNKFTVNTSTAFEGKPEGYWDYKAYGDSTLLEEGTMKLSGTAFTYKEHTPAQTTFKTYQG